MSLIKKSTTYEDNTQELNSNYRSKQPQEIFEEFYKKFSTSKYDSAKEKFVNNIIEEVIRKEANL